MILFADTETHAFTDDEPIPRLVVNSFADAACNGRLVPRWEFSADLLRKVLGGTVVLAGGSYDLLVWLHAYPEVLPDMIRALRGGRIRDVALREKMIDHAYGARTRASRYDLATIAKNRAGITDIDKSDPYRLLYGGLDGVPLDLWPAGARDYAQRDTTVLPPIYAEQELHADVLQDEPRQVRAALALAAMSARGIALDQTRVAKLDELYQRRRAELEAELMQTEPPLARFKHKRKRPSPVVKSEKEAKALIVRLSEQTGQPYERTPKGAPALNAEALEALSIPPEHPLYKYRALGSLSSKFSTYLDPFRDRDVVRTSFDPCVQTNRTSSFGPNLQNLPRDVLAWLSKDELPMISPGIEYPSKRPLKPRPLGFRECMVARPGYVFVTSDWSMMELVCLAQKCLRKFGWSRLAEALQDGRDAHEELGSTIAGFDIRGHELRKMYRTLAKAPNFGFPGGLGAARFVAWANGAYGEALREYGVVIDEPFAKQLKEHWRKQWPEMVLYHKWIGSLTQGGNQATLRLSSGYTRGGMGFTDASNFPFQGEAALTAKDALYMCWEESVKPGGMLEGSYPVLFVHDEIVIECPIAKAWEHAGALETIMLTALRNSCPDVPGGVETMITTCYTK
ncbi:MAG: DNA polymerase [Planctomycetota bacterium]|nr:DNA polymerase [Planctomycetota bacterium]